MTEKKTHWELNGRARTQDTLEVRHFHCTERKSKQTGQTLEVRHSRHPPRVQRTDTWPDTTLATAKSPLRKEQRSTVETLRCSGRRLHVARGQPLQNNCHTENTKKGGRESKCVMHFTKRTDMIDTRPDITEAARKIRLVIASVLVNIT